MPLKGEELDELLSGFLDGQLTAAELQTVQEILAEDPDAAKQLEALRRQQQQLKQVGERLTARAGLPADFSQRILATAAQQVAGLDLPDGHHAHSAASMAPEIAQPAGGVGWSRRTVGIAASLAVVAALLLAVSIPKLLVPHNADQPIALDPPVEVEPGHELATDSPATVEYVVEQEAAKINFVLVCDIQIKRQAHREHRLADVFSAAGIQRGIPVQADAALQKTLGDTRMIVQPEQPSERETIFYFVRADMADLSDAIDLVWRDKESFPNVRLDLAYDHPRVQLMREILRRSSRQAAGGQALAVPLAATESDVEASVPSPFPGAESTVKYVSATSRSRGWDAAGSMAPPNTNAYLLFVGHIVD